MMLEHRRPDVVLVLREKRFLFLLEMACAFDSLVEEREKEKADKYEQLATDMAVHQPGYKVTVLHAMQLRVLYSSTGILKHHLAG